MLEPKDFIRDPQAMGRVWSVEESLAYTHWLATHHYENFHVVSVLLPKRLHQDFYNVYAFCRWADDLGDEIPDKAECLQLLKWWRTEFDAMCAGQSRHPVFVALGPTLQRHDLEPSLFHDLITAFEQDQVVPRYQDWEQLFRYCKYSANPVGRLVLGLCGYSGVERNLLSDATCTALQLANFWQDITVDLQKDRVYIPASVMEKYGYKEPDLFALKFDERFQNVMSECVGVARKLFDDGLPLTRMVDRRLSIDLTLFSRGGIFILDKIESQGYNVLAARPKISKVERVGILLKALAEVAFQRAA